MAPLAFWKVEGLGNDFLLLDRRTAPAADVEAEVHALQSAAPTLCDRHRGVGGDGILVLGPDAELDGRMWVVNYDGSRPEMCGNGLRCVALVLGASTGRDDLRIATDAGPRRCRILAHTGGPGPGLHGEVEVDMGPGRALGPVIVDAWPGPLTTVSMGNPHAIAFVDADPETLARTLGPRIERDAAFPAGTNVEFCRPHPDHLELWVWERGCGITSACGTGACATAFAATETGRMPVGVPIRVELPGGALAITVPPGPGGGIAMRGPARVVFAGHTP